MTSKRSKRRIEIYDTTLRDGAQGEGVAFSLVDKLKITQHLDALGVDYIEGGYPLSNPKDEAYFKQVADLQLRHAKVCAFGMTRRRGVAARDDPGMMALAASGSPVATIVGKSSALHVEQVLRVDLDENIQMIRDSVEFCRAAGMQVFYDAEHFFDGCAANGDYALATLRAASESGAARLILCDTNGGSLPAWIAQAIGEVKQQLGADLDLGIHCHNDSGLAVADSLTAIENGCIQVQGTINGIGERCGNADLTTIAANLRLKMGYDCLRGDSLRRLTETSRYVYELANMNIEAKQPFVGSGAFAHKGGMHVHAVQRATQSYEHVEPQSVGNTRRILVSELSGASNISAALGDKFNISDDKQLQRRLVERVQDLEHRGYQFEAATASFELLVHEALGQRPTYWQLDHYRCVILKAQGQPPVTEAIVKLCFADRFEHCVAEGDGPVNALDGALRKCLRGRYPQIDQVHLRDYRVRVVNPTAESAATVRVIAEFAVGEPAPGETKYFATVGVNENIVDASWQAITDAFDYHLIECAVASE